MKFHIFVAVFMLLAPFVFSDVSVDYLPKGSDIYYSLDITAKLNSTELNAGELLKATITIANFEEFPVADIYVVADIANENSSGTAFYESIVPAISVGARKNKQIEFSYTLPSDLAAGKYYLMLYVLTPRTLATTGSSPSFFRSPKVYEFSVKGKGMFPEARILRTKTFFYDMNGYEVSSKENIHIKKGEEIKGKIFVSNSSSSELKDLKLKVSVCKGEDSICKKQESSAEYKIGSIAAGKEASVDVSLDGVSASGEYSIRMELLQGQELLSFSRSAFVINEPSLAIRKLSINKPYFKNGEEMLLNAYVEEISFEDGELLGAPSLSLWIEDSTGKKILSSDVSLSGISKEMPVAHARVNFYAPKELSDFKVCASAEEKKISLDSYCYEVDSSEFVVEEKSVSKVSASWSYDGIGTLTLKFVQKSTALPLDITYLIFDADGSLVSQGNVSAESSGEATETIKAGEYKLILNDMVGKTQQSIALSLSPSGNSLLKSCKETGGSICTLAEECKGSYSKANDSEFCCIGECVIKNPVEGERNLGPKPLFDNFLLYFIGVICILFIIAGIFIKQKRNSVLKG